MSLKAWIKVTCVFAYMCLVAFVPEMPSIYTLCISCLGFCLTISASVILIHFLNTRPPAQKNLLNRILVLLTGVLNLGTVRCFLVSVLAYFWNSELKAVTDAYPAIIAGIFSVRFYTIMEIIVICILSTGRLLLFSNPAIFNNLAPFATPGAVFAGLLALGISALDMVLLSFMCSENPNTWMLFIFKSEAGINNIQNNVMNNTTRIIEDDHYAKNTTRIIEDDHYANNTTRIIEDDHYANNTIRIIEDDHYANNTTRIIEDDQLCSLPPTIYIVITSIMILETSTMVYIFIKEYKKLRRNKVSHAEPSRPVRSEVIWNQRLIQRSESLPLFKPKVKENLRRSSLHSVGGTAVDICEAEIVVAVQDISTLTSQLNSNNAGANEIKILAKQTFQKHFLKTASFLTTFSLAGMLIKCVSFLTAGSSFRAFPEIAMIRLVAYVPLVLIIYFDKDILSFISTYL